MGLFAVLSNKRGLKRKVVMVQLRVLGMLGMHEKKAQVLRNSGLFKKYGGGGGTGIL